MLKKILKHLKFTKKSKKKVYVFFFCCETFWQGNFSRENSELVIVTFSSGEFIFKADYLFIE